MHFDANEQNKLEPPPQQAAERTLEPGRSGACKHNQNMSPKATALGKVCPPNGGRANCRRASQLRRENSNQGTITLRNLSVTRTLRMVRFRWLLAPN